MGEILLVKCSCGYESEDLHVGCGMAGPEWCRELAACAQCRELVTVRSTRKQRCPQCRRPIVIVSVPEPALVTAGATGGRAAEMPLDAPCPQCGKVAMRATEIGLWD